MNNTNDHVCNSLQTTLNNVVYRNSFYTKPLKDKEENYRKMPSIKLGSAYTNPTNDLYGVLELIMSKNVQLIYHIFRLNSLYKMKYAIAQG